MNRMFSRLTFVVFAFLVILSLSLPAIASTEILISNRAGYNDNPAISGDKIVWSNDSINIFMFDLTTQIETQITVQHQWYNLIRYTPRISGNKIVWTEHRNGTNLYDVYMYDLTTQVTTRINVSEGYNCCAVISGNKIAWSDGNIYVYDLATQTESQLTISGRAYHPEISGNKIVWFEGRYSDGSHVYLYNFDTLTETQISTGPSEQVYPVIYGDKVAWVDYNWRYPGLYSLHVYDVTTQAVKKIVTNTVYAYTKNLAISGDRAVWVDNRNGNTDIYMYDLATQTEVQITTNTAGQMYPAISGDKIVWSDGRNGGWDIYMYDLYTPPVNILPIAQIGPVQMILLGESITLDGSASYDPDGIIASYQWNFDDGTNSTGAIVTHTYAASGSYQVTLMIADNAGGTASATITVLVQTPAQATSSLISVIQDMNLVRGITNSLDAKLQNAIDAMNSANSGNRADAANKLQAFINATYAQRGNQLTIQQADQLIAAANRIIAIL